MALASLIVGAIGVLIGVTAFFRDWQLRRDLVLVALSPHLRAALEEARNKLGESIDEGGEERNALQEHLRQTIQRFEESVNAVKDPLLQTAINGVLSATRGAIDAAPEVRYLSAYEPETVHTDHVATLERVVEHCKSADQAAASALKRLSQLEAKAPRS